ncbi:KINASE CX32 putative-RELATED [Salix viminalis]|uniref:KINASE CX32 putative-RELATED n=1 Tax=Salix viminalis TaxID=40686 RepID=A0A9Q0SDT9_SALVM|nr:KINASE CX32 putative-RELATED [Salix viminalis]
MGNFWSCLSDKSNQAIASAAEAPVLEPIPETAPSTINDLLDGKSNPAIASEAEDPVLKLIPDPDPAPSSINDLIDATTNFNCLGCLKQVVLLQLFGDDDNELLPEIDGGFLPDGGSASDSKREGFGNVYKGWLKEKVPSQDTRKWPIAVKRLHASSKQGHRQWQAEVGFLARLSHPNIIKLVGYCREKEEYLIAYEFMQKGSLNYHLFGKKPDRVLSWEIRLKIAMEIAEGLAYLHSLERPVIHKDLKPANILLDKSYTAKISDFGLATTAPASSRDHDEYIQEDIICGTYGYIDPFYARNGKLHVKSDVYSFGVVLVELLTGLKLMKNITDGSSTFEEWSEKYLNNRFRLRGIMDSRLEGKYATGQASEIAMLALRCLVSTPKFRPSMKEVAETLEKIKTRAYNRKHLVMCGKCHEAGHYTRSCEKISQVGGNSKLPNASEATTEKKTSSTQSTVLQDSERSEASGVVTETLQITPSSSNLLDASNATKNEKTSAIQSPHPQQGSKRDEANHIGTNKPRNNHPRKTTAVGGNSKALEARNTTKKEKTSSSRLTVQQGNTRKEANGVATSPSCNSTPKTKIPTGATTEEKISTTKSIVRQGKKINETNGAVTSTARSKGPKKINTSMSELPNASNVGRKVRAQSTAQQVNKRNVPTHGGISIK